jgi:hypothetical protein
MLDRAIAALKSNRHESDNGPAVQSLTWTPTTGRFFAGKK